jgi:hypothetical protein
MGIQPGIFVITGDDTLIINGHKILTAADGGVFDVTRPNALATGKIGKNGNAIVAANQTGRLADMTIRLLLGNDDDKYLLGLLNNFLNFPPGFSLLTGQFTKNLGDGSGNIQHVTYNLTGGYFLKDTPMSFHVEGNTDQAVAIYPLQWLYAVRAID